MEEDKAQELIKILFKLRKTITTVGPYNYFSKFGVNPNEFFALHAIKSQMKSCIGDDFYGLTMSDIGKKLDIAKPAISVLISSLEKKGLVTRNYSASDRRLVYVKLTENGNKIFNTAQLYFGENINSVISILGIENTDTLIFLLKKLYDGILENREKEN